MHPLRQTSFPNTIDAEMHSATTPGPSLSHARTFSAASDGGNSVTGSFTGSLGGSTAEGVFTQQQQQQQKGGKKRGRKSKAEKEREREREREREDALSSFGGRGESRVGSVDMDGRSFRGGGGGGGGATGTTTGGAGGGGGGGDEGGDDEEDFDDEGELLGREEGATDAEAEKKNLAYVLMPRCRLCGIGSIADNYDDD